MTMMEEKTFKCPIDGEIFEDGIIISTNQMGQHTDFKPVVGGVFPFPFYVHACPKCGFSGYDEDFNEEYSDDFKEWVKSELAAQLESGALYGGLKYLLAAQCAEKTGREEKEIGDRYLRGAWCAQDEESEELEARCRKESASHFIKAIEAGEYEKNDRAAVTYLVGELYRRLGMPDEAAEWFGRVQGEVTDPGEQAWVLTMAEKQKTSPVELFPEDLVQ